MHLLLTRDHMKKVNRMDKCLNAENGVFSRCEDEEIKAQMKSYLDTMQLYCTEVAGIIFVCFSMDLEFRWVIAVHHTTINHDTVLTKRLINYLYMYVMY